MTYWALNACFLAVVALAWVAVLIRHRHRPRGLPWRAVLATLAVILAATAVFDNLMIAVDLFGYREEKISGAFLGLAPLEDFGYAIAAALGLPALWLLLPARPTPEEKR